MRLTKRMIGAVCLTLAMSIATVAHAQGDRSAGDRATQVFPLQHRDADSVALFYSNVHGTELSKGVSMAVDGRANRIIASGSAEQMQRISQFIADVDQPLPESATRSTAPTTGRIRVVWLIDSGEPAANETGNDMPMQVLGTPGRAVPPDLGRVIDAVRPLGVENLRMVGQWMARVDDNGRFAVTGTVGSRTPYMDVSIEGERRAHKPAEGEPHYAAGNKPKQPPPPGNLFDITLIARAPYAIEDKTEWMDIAALQTVIDAPAGRPIVMGMNATGPLTSVFVVVRYEDELMPPAESTPETGDAP